MAGFALPVGNNGEVLPHNHPSLQGDARILRGVLTDHVVTDANYGCRRLSSALFKNKPQRQGYLSFNSQPCIEARGQNPTGYMFDLTPHRRWLGVISISVEDFRAFDPAENANDEWKIGLVPLEDEQPPDPCHGAVWGTITKPKADMIRRAVEWMIGIPGVVIDEAQVPQA